MVFAIREHASTAIFLGARAEIQKLALRAASIEQLREYNSQAASTYYISRLQQSIWKSFSFNKIKQKIF